MKHIIKQSNSKQSNSKERNSKERNNKERIIKQPIGGGKYLYFTMRGGIMSGGDPSKPNANEEKKDENNKEGEEKKEGEGEGEGEGADDENKSKDANGKCVGADTCAVGDGIAGNLSAPAKKYEGFDSMVKDKIYKGIKNGFTNLTDAAKCPIYVAEKIPDMIPNMIEKIGESTANAFNNVSNSIKNLFDQVSGQEIKGYPNIFGPFEVAYAFVIIKLQNIINKIALGEDADKILADPNIKSGELLAKMMRTSKRYKDAFKEAEFQNVFKEWMKDYTDALLETLDIAKPEVNRINTEISNIIEGMGDNVGKSLSNALVNVVRSVVSNIPFVGGIVSAVMSADQLGQEIINACKPPIVKGAGIVMPVVNGFNKQVDKTKCQVNDLVEKIEPIMKKMEAKANSVGEKIEAKVDKMTAQQGGGKKTAKNIGDKINHATRRVKYMLSRFRNNQRNIITASATRRAHQRKVKNTRKK